jgi:hypothetical protein
VFSSENDRSAEKAGQPALSRPRRKRPRWSVGRACGVLSWCLVAGVSRGEDIIAKTVTFQGFGTAAVAYHDEPGLEYRRSTSQGRGAGAGEIDLETDSALGLQASLAPRDDLQLVLQGVTQQNADGAWRPHVARAFLRYSPSANVLLRAGRIGYDSYLLAESPAVGYSYLPIRPAPEFFGLFATDDVDGADVAVTRRAGAGIARARVFVGNTSGDQVYQFGSVAPTSSDVLGGQLDYGVHEWLVRLGAIGVRVRRTPDLSSLANALRATGFEESINLAEKIEKSGETIRAYQLAVAYDGRPLQGQLMLTRVDSDMIAAPRVNSGIAVLGYRHRRITPYVSFAAVKSFAAIHSTGLPEEPWFEPLNAAVRNAQTAAQTTQRTQSAGVRYDVTSRLDLKFQVDRVELRDTNLIFDHLGLPRDRARMTLFGVSADFLF